MKVVILCGGQGTRLREHTETLPKPMVEIGGRPVLWHIMKIYAHFGFTNFVLCLGYKGHVIKDYFANYELRNNDFTVQIGKNAGIEIHGKNEEIDWRVTLVDTGESAQTGARLFRVRDHLANEPFCLTYGDGLGNIDLNQLHAFHREHGRIATITGVRPPGRFGELEVKSNAVTGFAEKPQATSGFINGGFFIFETSFIDRYLTDDDGLSLEQGPLQALTADNELMMYPHTGFWQPMDTFREWKMLDTMWNEDRADWKLWS